VDEEHAADAAGGNLVGKPSRRVAVWGWTVEAQHEHFPKLRRQSMRRSQCVARAEECWRRNPSR
jgi:hypothetical protein